jgi:rhodanese-related sulfurtransferase
MKHVSSLFFFLIVIACATSKTPTKSYDEIINSGIILDVRERDEVEAGTIAGSLWVPLSDAKSDTQKVRDIVSKISRDKEIFVYCRSGRRSEEFIEILGNDFETTNLGGFEDLRKRGFQKGYYIDYLSYR